MTDFRIGFIASKRKSLVNNLISHQQSISTCVNSPSQYSAITLNSVMDRVKFFRDYYLEDRNLILDEIPQFEPYKPHGGFYYFINLQEFGVKDAEKFSIDLLEKYSVSVVPGYAYGKGFVSWIRISFAVDQNCLKKGIRKVKNYLF